MPTEASWYRTAIRAAGLNISTPVHRDSELFIPTEVLEIMLADLIGINLVGFPIRTRSKRVKSAVCEALGYDIPTSFKKTRPRFIGQNLDIFVQKSRNIQVWNEAVDPLRRYAIFRVNTKNVISSVRVLSGETLSAFDKTGTLTSKFQASAKFLDKIDLVNRDESTAVSAFYGMHDLAQANPSTDPLLGSLLPIADLSAKLAKLLGHKLLNVGAEQERLRGEALHREVVKILGYAQYSDRGNFPDIRNQLLELKLQTSPTIDLGLVLPTSETLLDIRNNATYGIRHCDVRYAVFGAEAHGKHLTITHLVLVSGSHFANRFNLFEGLRENRKLQIVIPETFF